MGGKIRLDLRVIQAPEGTSMASLAEVGAEDGVFDLVSRTGARLRQVMGVAPPSQEQVRQARALQPSSPEANRLYAEGLKKLRAFDPPGALGFLQRAAQADPDSAAIHFALSKTWWDLGQDAKSAKEARRAVDLSHSLSHQERLEIQGWLFQVSREWEKAIETYRSLWTFYPDETEFGLQLVECLTSSGRAAEAVEIIAALRAQPSPHGDDPRIDLAESRNALRLSDAATQKRTAEAAAAKGRRSGQTLVVARALVFQGDSLLKMGRPREAVPLFQEAVTMARKAGHQWVVGMALANQGIALKSLGDLAGAERVNREALAIAERLGSSIGIAAQLYYIGELRWQRGDLAEAQKLVEQSYEHYVASGDPLKQVRSLSLLGEVLSAGGKLAGARKRLETALVLSRSLGNPVAEAGVLSGLAELAAQQGDLATSRSLAEDQLRLARQADSKALTAQAHINLGRVDLAQGNLDAARRSLREVERNAGEDRQIRLESAVLQARLAAAEGRAAAAQTVLRQAIREAETQGFIPLALEARFVLGEIQQEAGDPAAGATLAAVRRDAEARGFKRLYSEATPISASSGRAASPPSAASSQKR
jgi:tetratricopeptide (TPR) repeat protein